MNHGPCGGIGRYITMPYKDINDKRKCWLRWKRRNPEKAKEYRKKWKESNYVKLNHQQENLNQKYRRKLLKERGEMCEICKKTENIHMHHIDFNNANNRNDNLLLLCNLCHEDKHHANPCQGPPLTTGARRCLV